MEMPSKLKFSFFETSNRKTFSFYIPLKNERIGNIQFELIKNMNGQHLSNANIITRIMGSFLEVRPKFGSAPFLKLMHMANLDLFVMWDTGIKTKYNIPIYYITNYSKWY